MPTVETSLGHLEAIRKNLQLKNELYYVFKLGCGCSVYNKDDVLGHLWDKCEHQDSEFWCERYSEHGRTVKHHLRVDEIDTIWAGVDVARDDLEHLRKRGEEINTELNFKNTHDYVKVLEVFHPIYSETMTVLEEKQMCDQIREWYLRENIIPPIFEKLHVLALTKVALNSVLAEFELNADTGRLTLFGFGDQLED